MKKPKDFDENSSDDENSNEDDPTLTYRIDSASYKGTQLHRAEEFKIKIAEGFQLNKLSWDCKEKDNVNSDIFKLSVKLNESKNRKILSFISKGFIKYNTEKDEYLKNPQPLPSINEKIFNKLIFETALSLLSPPRLNVAKTKDKSA